MGMLFLFNELDDGKELGLGSFQGKLVYFRILYSKRAYHRAFTQKNFSIKMFNVILQVI